MAQEKSTIGETLFSGGPFTLARMASAYDRVAVAEYVRDWLNKHIKGHGDVLRIAQELGVKPQSLSQIRSTGKKLGRTTEPAFAQKLAGGSIDALHRDAISWYRKRGRPELRTVAPVTGNMPGWDRAERQAREKYGVRLSIPDWAWEKARMIAGAALPSEVTAETVKDAALFALHHARRDD